MSTMNSPMTILNVKQTPLSNYNRMTTPDRFNSEINVLKTNSSTADFTNINSSFNNRINDNTLFKENVNNGGILPVKYRVPSNIK